MARYKVKAFGITREILGGRDNVLEFSGNTVGDLRQFLMARYPELGSLRSLFVAVNHEYAEDATALEETDEIALIPPVAGG